MCSRAPLLTLLAALLALALAQGAPVTRTLSFNVFVLKPGAAAGGEGEGEGGAKLLLATDGVSRLGPALEYLVQRVQGLLSASNSAPAPAPAPAAAALLRPSSRDPAVLELQIPVTVDDDQPL